MKTRTKNNKKARSKKEGEKMETTSVPIIILCAYIIGEIYKTIFKKNKKLKNLTLIIQSTIGGILGILIYLTNKEMIFNVDNIWIAIGIGIISGGSATGTNKVIKKILNKKEEE